MTTHHHLIRKASERFPRSLRARLQVTLVLMLVPLVGVGAVGFGFLQHSSAAFHRVCAQAAAESRVLDQVRGLLGQTHPLAQAYVTKRDTKARAEFDRIAREAGASFATLSRLYAERDASVVPGRAKWERARADAERAFRLPVLPADDPSVEYPLFPFHQLADSAANELSVAQAASFDRVNAEAADARREKHTQLLLFLGIFLVTGVAAVTVARRLGRSITVPLRRLEDAAARLSDDDLSARVPVERKDELGRVSDTFNLMATRLEESRETRVELEEQLRHAQKMEAVGRLAGGIAHDFNNLLMAIRGQCELLRRRLGDSRSNQVKLEQIGASLRTCQERLDEAQARGRAGEDSIAHDFRNLLAGILGYTELLLRGSDRPNSVAAELEEISAAADRAASLTRQLLAFSRKQILQPEVLDANGLLADVSGLLRRMIGEDVELTTRLGHDVAPIEGDRGQIEQVLMNLAINARDAMPDGGTLTIETANVDLDESYAKQHAGVVPGRYVMLAVSDTGHGMDARTREQIFEPFFTTKESGKGTGLGLSTVYGIVKQSGGSIYVYSEPGRGTTFKVYLPRTDRIVSAGPSEAQPQASGGSETILLVEDEEILVSVVTGMLEERGYRVLAARSGEEALAVAAKEGHAIDLVITDVVMPKMNGPELADRLGAHIPRLKVLYTSGYTDEAIVHHGVLDAGVAFLQKPFTMADLDRKLRDVFGRTLLASAAARLDGAGADAVLIGQSR